MKTKTKKPSFLSTFLGKTVADFGWSPVTAKLDDPDSVGIEIEFEGVPDEGVNLPGVKNWTLHEDGSLRNGAEFVSSRPRPFKEIGSDVDALIKGFASKQFTPVFSFRTSLHVHVNVLDLTHLELLNFFALYTLFEQPLLELGGEERIGNVHCLPVFLASYPLTELRGGLSEKPGYRIDQTFQRLMRNNLRYASFNWAAVSKFGSVEFRSHRGTLDRDVIVRWVNLLMEMKQASRRFDNPQSIVQNFSMMGPEDFTKAIFGNEVVRDMCKLRTTELWEGLRNMQFFAFAPKDWTVVEPKDVAAEPPKVKHMFRGAAGGDIIHDEIQGDRRMNVDWDQWMQQAAGLRADALPADAQRVLEEMRQRRARNLQQPDDHL